MRLILLAIFLACCHGVEISRQRPPQMFGRHNGPPPPTGKPNERAVEPEWGWITQNVDHFRASETRTWQMRYLNNSQFFQPGGPIFIYLGGEWTIQPVTLTTGQIFDLAQDYNGYLFYTEHRYYGESYPTEDFAPENLKFLSVEQALADLAYFITYQKETVADFRDSKVVVIGSSYSASMATWARLKYPHLIDISYASSGVVLAVTDFYEYNEVVNDVIGRVAPVCLDTIRASFQQLQQVVDGEDAAAIGESFNTCTPLINQGNHRMYFFYGLSQIFAEVVQYGTEDIVSYYCGVFVDSPGETELEKLINFIRGIYGDYCFDSYEAFLGRYATTELSSDYYRQWLHQMCTEFGWFQTSTSTAQPFGPNFPLDSFLSVCVDLFGPQFTETVISIGGNRTNLLNGAQSPSLTKVISVQGSLDPWHRLGITEDLNPLAPAIFIQGSSHCADLSSVSDDDIPALREAKLRIRQIIADWLQEIM